MDQFDWAWFAALGTVAEPQSYMFFCLEYPIYNGGRTPILHVLLFRVPYLQQHQDQLEGLGHIVPSPYRCRAFKPFCLGRLYTAGPLTTRFHSARIRSERLQIAHLESWPQDVRRSF